MRKRLVGVLTATALVAGGTFAAVSAGAAPTQETTSLEEAASQPIGIGARNLARDLGTTSRPAVDPVGVVGDAAAKAGGCLTTYGRPGQCLPTVPPSQAEHVAMGHMLPHWTCAEVRTMFAKGLAVREKGVDPLLLDSNLDGTACGKGDA